MQKEKFDLKEKNKLNNKKMASKKKKQAINFEIMINERSIFKKSFLIAGIGFLIIFTFGFVLKYIVEGYDILESEINSTTKFNFDMYQEILKSNDLGNLAKISVGAIGLIIVSCVFNLIWSFRVTKASKSFMFLSFYTYLIAQGLGFGTLFITWKATDLMIIFAISGVVLLFMSLVGYLSKQFLALGKWLMIGWAFVWIYVIINLILFFTKVYEDEVNTIAFSVAGFLTLVWLSYQIWSIRKTVEFENELSKFEYQSRFRLKMWWAFRIVSDFIVIISIFGYLIKKLRTNKA